QEFVLFLYKVLPVSVIRKHHIFDDMQDEFLKITTETFEWSSKSFLVLFNSKKGRLVCSKVPKLWFQDKEISIEEVGFIFLNPTDIKVNAGKQVFKVKYESVEFFGLSRSLLYLRIKNNNNLKVQLEVVMSAEIKEHLLKEGIRMDLSEGWVTDKDRGSL